MTTAFHLNSRLTRITLWLSERPVLVRAAMVALPVVLALAAALLSHSAAYACQPGTGGGGCGG